MGNSSPAQAQQRTSSSAQHHGNPRKPQKLEHDEEHAYTATATATNTMSG